MKPIITLVLAMVIGVQVALLIDLFASGSGGLRLRGGPPTIEALANQVVEKEAKLCAPMIHQVIVPVNAFEVQEPTPIDKILTVYGFTFWWSYTKPKPQVKTKPAVVEPILTPPTEDPN